MDEPINVKVILGSTRQGRMSERISSWLMEELGKRSDLHAELLDLREYPMPFFAEPETPGYKKAPYQNEVVAKWTAKIKEGDAFIVVTPEYNHGYPAVLKNAFDYVYQEWNRKPIGFASFGSALGARAVEQLRQVVIELQMAPIRPALHFAYATVAGQGAPAELFAGSAKALENFLADLLWWARALKPARGGK